MDGIIVKQKAEFRESALAVIATGGNRRIFAVTAFLALSLVTVAGAEEIRLPGGAYSSQSSSLSFGSALTQGGDEVYRIGASDVLTIQVWQSPDLNRDLQVRFDGRIAFPLAGEIIAAGLTPLELAAEIAEHLREFIRSPQVTVTVKEFQSRQVLVLGSIGRAGIYPLRGPMKILELLTAAGLNLTTTDLRNITVIRTNGEVLKIDIESLLYRQDVKQNIELKAGDSIFVPEKVAVPTASSTSGGSGADGRPGVVRAQEIMVMGEIGKAGLLTFPPDKVVTVKEVLLLSGGTVERSWLESAKIIRSDKIQEPVDLYKLIFNGDMSQDLTMHSGDILFVPRRPSIKFYVIGEVGAAGFREVQTNNLDLLQAMTLVNPAKFGAVLANVKIIRGWPNNPKVISANVEALLFKGDLSQNIPIENNDVIFVPRSFFASLVDVLPRITGFLTGTAGSVEDLSEVGSGTTTTSTTRSR